MGAIATGGVRVLNPEVIDSLSIPPAVIEAVTAAEDQELQRRERLYRFWKKAVTRSFDWTEN